MIRENNIVIDPKKSSEFVGFLKKIGKSEQFWDENRNIARTKVDEAELDRLFEGENQ